MNLCCYFYQNTHYFDSFFGLGQFAQFANWNNFLEFPQLFNMFSDRIPFVSCCKFIHIFHKLDKKTSFSSISRNVNFCHYAIFLSAIFPGNNLCCIKNFQLTYFFHVPFSTWFNFLYKMHRIWVKLHRFQYKIYQKFQNKTNSIRSTEN